MEPSVHVQFHGPVPDTLLAVSPSPQSVEVLGAEESVVSSAGPQEAIGAAIAGAEQLSFEAGAVPRAGRSHLHVQLAPLLVGVVAVPRAASHKPEAGAVE